MAVRSGLQGFGHCLRPVDRGDAPTIFELRTDPKLGKYLHPTRGGVADQEHWVETQRARVGDYYFVIERLDGRSEGIVGLYGIEGNSGEWGRWILRRGSLAAPASVLLLLRFGFDQLGLQRIYSRTMAGNDVVVSFHDSCNYTERSDYVDPSGQAFVEHSLSRPDWPTFHDALEPMARRVALRLDIS